MRNAPRDPFVLALLALSLFSLAVWVLAALTGATKAPPGAPDGFVTYFQAINWWPFPVFYLVFIPVLYLTWHSFLPAWQDLRRTGVLLTKDATAPDAEMMGHLTGDLTAMRRWPIFAAILAAIIVNFIDTGSHRAVIFGSPTAVDQAAWACERPNFSASWVFDAAADRGAAINCAAADFGQPKDASPASLPADYALLLLSLLIQQLAIVFFPALAFAQLLLHSLAFGWLEKWSPTARRNSIRIRLNAASPMREFGLERWNYVLNNFYWASCPALLGVFMSRLSTDPNDYYPGQVMLGWIVPALLLAPMIITILSRQVRLPDLWERLDDADEATASAYQRQQLWPLDRNWSSKLGIILAFLLASLSLGYEVSRLIPL